MEQAVAIDKRRNNIQVTKGDRFYYMVVGLLLTLLLIVLIYPIIYIVSASFSSANAVTSGKVLLWPVDPGLDGYRAVFKHSLFFRSFENSFVYTLIGTLLNLSMTIIAAYPLSRRDMPFKGLIMFLFTFTMIFSGGMIPDYILLKDLSMIDTIWALALPGSINVVYLIIMRTFMMHSVPSELLEASQIDGCSDTKYFFRILLPLSGPVIAVVTLYYAVGHWNNYFHALLYMYTPEKFPLQLILREILIANTMETNMVSDPSLAEAQQSLADLLKYSLIILSSAPLLILSPFVKRFFAKGAMIGAIKG
ncbi:carbohydrate ABC transporter permease [Cohnella sp. WQ 127256]|uniref:carbohydrate ABC transporter permease n=1 Tax=Cohnella sp. WQ 127256 TaxID=2938790 RepID=UPI002118D22B|nr:carbohydrate ABC transporter permease [Cohnella sp. WQ 127256]